MAKSAISKDRSYSDGAGRQLILRSGRDITEDGGWILELKLYERRLFGRKLIDSKSARKSGEWSTSAIGLLQAQEELEILRAAGVDIDLTGLIC